MTQVLWWLVAFFMGVLVLPHLPLAEKVVFGFLVTTYTVLSALVGMNVQRDLVAT